MDPLPCDRCGAPRTPAGCCPTCSPCRSARLGAPAIALLGLIACNGGDTDTDTDTGGAEPPYGVGAMDDDADGYGADVDCNDQDAAVYPGAPEVPNGKDDDCDEEIDEP